METQGTLLKRLWHLLLCSGRRGGGSSVAAIEKIMKSLGKFAADLTQIFRLDVIPGLVLLLGDIEYGPGQKPGKESFSICGGMEAMLLESGVCMGQVGFTAGQVGSHGWCLACQRHFCEATYLCQPYKLDFEGWQLKGQLWSMEKWWTSP